MKEFNIKIQERFNNLSKSGKLFRVKLTGQEIWDMYLQAFSSEDDPIFRDPESSTHNCNHCKNFVRRYGNIVSLDENFQIQTMFDVDDAGEYQESATRISDAIKSSQLKDVFFETYDELNSLPYESCSKSSNVFQLGLPENTKRYTKEEAEKFGVVKENEIKKFNHMSLKIDKMFVDTSGNSIESIMSKFRDNKNVFKRGMEELNQDTLKLVIDLIKQGSLLDGTTHLSKVEEILKAKKEFDGLSQRSRDNWCWFKSYNYPLAKFKNELIGVLCTELAEGEELNKACQSWNKRVDPANYMKAIAPITKTQIEEAKKFVQQNDYEESFDRRLATIDDIKSSEILHLNTGDGEIKSVSIFDNIKSNTTRHKRSEFDKVEEVHIEKFMKDILPGCTSVELFLQNNHEGNLVTLTTARNPESKRIFKWDNNYSWTFNGNLAGKSQIKEQVASKGGRVDGVLRFSVMWADGNGDNSDLDLHCIEPNRFEIYYGNRVSYDTRGNLDVDIQTPGGKLAVENITYPNIKTMQEGVYKLYVNQYADRGSKGFQAEIEFGGETYSYNYSVAVRGKVLVAEVTLKNGDFTIVHKLPESNSNKSLYGLETNHFHKVNLLCLTPNYWGDNAVGNKHFLFMLEGCKADTSVRGFHNENLIPELAQHRKVLEVLGTTNMIEPSERQIAGVGFNSTVREEVVLKLSGTHKRVIKLKF